MTALSFICKQNVTLQLAISIEPVAKFQPPSQIIRSETLHSLDVVREHTPCMRSSPYSHLGNTKIFCHPSCTTTWTVMYSLNNAFFSNDTVMNFPLNCNVNAAKCTCILQCPINSSKHSSGCYSTSRKTSLVFSCGTNCSTITQTVYIHRICILYN